MEAPPATLRSFSVDDVIGVFAEVYPPGPDALEIRCRIMAVDGTVLFETVETRETDGRAVRYRAELPLGDVPPGPAVVTLGARLAGPDEIVSERVPIAVGDGAGR